MCSELGVSGNLAPLAGAPEHWGVRWGARDQAIPTTHARAVGPPEDPWVIVVKLLLLLIIDL